MLNVNKIQFVLEKEKNVSILLKDIFDFLIQKKLITKNDKNQIIKIKKILQIKQEFMTIIMLLSLSIYFKFIFQNISEINAAIIYLENT